MTMTNKALSSLAETYFGLTLPVNSVDLKKAYRAQCMKLHPDVGGDARDFKAMNEIYKRLTEEDVIAYTFASESEFRGAARTVDGLLLSELGLGLGPTTNGVDCYACKHKGYLVAYNKKRVRCSLCNGLGVEPFIVACNACKGTGKFKQARSKRIVECRVCNGSGEYRRLSPARRMHNCRRCHGNGEMYVADTSSKYYVKCHTCDGTGELPMFNPVLQKAVLSLGKEGK